MEYTDTLLLQFSFLIMASFTNTKLDAAAPMVVAMTRTRARLSRDRVLIHSSYSTGFNCSLQYQRLECRVGFRAFCPIHRRQAHKLSECLSKACLGPSEMLSLSIVNLYLFRHSRRLRRSLGATPFDNSDGPQAEFTVGPHDRCCYTRAVTLFCSFAQQPLVS